MLHPDFKDLLFALNSAKVDYLIVGGYAVAAHGYPRATQDLDVWLWSSPENAPKIVEALAAFGVPKEQLHAADFSNPNFILHMGVAPWRIDLLTHIPGVTFEIAHLHREMIDFDGVEMAVISKTHLIQAKAASGRPQDLADIAKLQSEQPGSQNT